MRTGTRRAGAERADRRGDDGAGRSGTDENGRRPMDGARELTEQSTGIRWRMQAAARAWCGVLTVIRRSSSRGEGCASGSG